MRMITTLALAVGCIAAITVGAIAPVHAQYYYPPPPPGYGGYGNYGYRTFNGCPPGYTIQDGVCKPYQGPVGPGYGYYGRY